MRAVISVWVWLSLLLVATVGFLIQLPLMMVTFPFDRRRRIVGRFYHLLAVAIVKLNPLWRFRIHGTVPDYRPRRAVVVSNHVSNSDAFLIAHLPWEMKWLGKSSLFWIPFVGWGMWLAGDVPVVRGGRDSVRRAMQECARYVERGMPVMIFPEGTRSRTAELLPFKDGAFRLAIETGADVLPIAVAGTRPALPKHSWMFGSADALVTVGEPVATEGMTLDDLGELKAEVRRRIEALYAEIAPRASD